MARWVDSPGSAPIPPPPAPPGGADTAQRSAPASSATTPAAVPEMRSKPASTRRTLIIVAAVVLALCTVSAGIGFMIAVVQDPGMSSNLPATLSADEESSVRGLAASIFEMGKQGNSPSFIALGAGDTHVEPGSLSKQFASTFGTVTPVDYAIDEQSVEVLVDQATKERIVVVRLKVTFADGAITTSGPLYMVGRSGEWRLTGLAGRTVKAIE